VGRGFFFYNAKLHPVDGEDGSEADAVIVEGDRIVAVGTVSELKRSVRPGIEPVDLGGALLLPGFVDSHVHFLEFALRRTAVDLEGVQTLEAALERVRAAAKSIQPGSWIRGGGWDADRWGGRLPAASDLDGAAPHHPVALLSKDGHGLWANSAAMSAAGVNRNTPDPEGGVVVRDHDGEPGGVFFERAVELISGAIKAPSPEECADALTEAVSYAHSRGLVGVHDAEGADAFGAFQRLDLAGRLTLRVLMLVPERALDAAARLGVRSGFGSDLLRIGQVKLFADGSLRSRTAEMIAPYDDEPDHRGVSVHSLEQLAYLIGRCREYGFGVAIHAIGDAANRKVLCALEAADRAPCVEDGPARQVPDRIEHVQLLAPDDLERFKASGAVASMQPIHAPSDAEIALRRWGDRCTLAYAWRSLVDRGVVLAFGSDAPVETIDPFSGLYAAVTRRHPAGDGAGPFHPEQCLTLDEAVRAYTVGPAYAAGEAGRRGRIAPGMLADLVAVSEDIFSNPPEALLEARVRYTLVGGRVVYEGR